MAFLRFTSLAIQELCPGASWSMVGEDYDTLVWHDENKQKPSKEQVEAKAVQLANHFDCYTNRRKEYPPIEEYIDGVVKGDQEQIDSYIQKCLEVKLKYPKPE